MTDNAQPYAWRDRRTIGDPTTTMWTRPNSSSGNFGQPTKKNGGTSYHHRPLYRRILRVIGLGS